MNTSPLPAGSDPIELARSSAPAILAAASAHAGVPPEQLRLLEEESFRSETEGNPYCFMVLGERGMIGVTMMLREDGTLGEAKCTNV
jgi:hypothetical protein